MTELRIPHPAVPEEDVMHLFAADTAFQLARERRERLLDQAARHRRLRRRPVALPTPPPDAA